MRYSLAFAGDARPDLQALEAWLQEDVLDELEILAGDPSLVPTSFTDDVIVYAFSRAAAGAKHYVAVTLSRNDSSRTLTVLGISHRRLPPT